MTDRYFSSVELLLGCDGADGSTTFTDSGPDVRTVTANGNAQLDTANFKWGTAAGMFDGSGDYLTVPASTDWGAHRTNGTIEFWLYHGAYSRLEYLASNRNGVSLQNVWVIELNGAQAAFTWWNSGSTIGGYNSSNINMVPGTWNHIRMCWVNRTIYNFCNGVLGNTVVMSNKPSSTSNTLYIGRDAATPTSRDLTGAIDDFRFTGDIARSTASFNLPGPLNRGKYVGTLNKFSQPVINVY